MAEKKYIDFDPGTPDSDRLILHADPVTGELERCTVAELNAQNQEYDNNQAAYAALGSEIKQWSVLFDLCQVFNQSNMANQTLKLIAVYIPKETVITGIAYMMAQSGNYTANNNNRLGLYSYAGGTLTLVASCANDAALWTATSAVVTKKPFTAAYTAAPGIYFIALLYCRSAEVTAPAMLSSGSTASSAFQTMDFTNSALLQGNKAGTTNLTSPLNINTFSSTTTWIWCAVY